MHSRVLPRRAFEEADSEGTQARLRQSGPADRMDIMEGTDGRTFRQQRSTHTQMLHTIIEEAQEWVRAGHTQIQSLWQGL